MVRLGRQQGEYRSFLKLNGRDAVSFLLGSGAVLGVLGLAYLLLLPSDSEGSVFLRYSAARVVLMTGPLLVMVVCGGLLALTWRDKKRGRQLEARLIRDDRLVPRLAAAGVVGAAILLMAMVLLQPEWITALNLFRVQRLLPSLGIPVGLLVLLWFAHRLATVGLELRVTSTGVDILCGGILFIISLAARLSLTGYALPYAGIWDEVVTYAPSLARIGGDGIADDSVVSLYGGAGYGELLIELSSAAQALGFLDGMRSQRVESLENYVSPAFGVATLSEGVHPSGIPLQYPRTVFALINSLAPVLVYVGLRRHLSAQRGPALLAGLLLALRSRDVVFYGAYIVPDGLAMTLFAGLLVCGMEMIRDQAGSLKWYGLSGFLVGLACGTVLRYLVLAATPAVGFLLAANRSRWISKIGLVGAGLAVGFFLSSPTFLTDMPRELMRLTRNVWDQDLSVANRAVSLVYYLRGLFDPSFIYYYAGIPVGEVGLGILAFGAAVVGAGSLTRHRPRYAAFLLGLGAIYLWWISPVQLRGTRHALALYPIACLLAGSGIQAIADAVSRLPREILLRRWNEAPGMTASPFWLAWAPKAVAAFFLVAFIPGIARNVRFVSHMAGYKTSQERMTDFLEGEMGSTEKVGILDVLPFNLVELYRRKIPFERIAAKATIADLQRLGVTLVVGTDLTSAEYESIEGTIWAVDFDGPGDRIAEFGDQDLSYRAIPKANAYLFAARIPPAGSSAMEMIE